MHKIKANISMIFNITVSVIQPNVPLKTFQNINIEYCFVTKAQHNYDYYNYNWNSKSFSLGKSEWKSSFEEWVQSGEHLQLLMTQTINNRVTVHCVWGPVFNRFFSEALSHSLVNPSSEPRSFRLRNMYTKYIICKLQLQRQTISLFCRKEIIFSFDYHFNEYTNCYSIDFSLKTFS